MKLKKFKFLDIIIDNPNSWMWNYIEVLENILKEHSQYVRIFRHLEEIKEGEVLFILSCNKIISAKILAKHKNNIVIHESDLPKGKGWSPLSYQVEAGKNEIPITLFEASIELDSGDWYLKDILELNGLELINDIRYKQAIKSFELITNFLEMYPILANKQIGVESFYKQRCSKNQEIDINLSIKDQFNKFRVCDNDRYPAYFTINNKKFMVKTYEIK